MFTIEKLYQERGISVLEKNNLSISFHDPNPPGQVRDCLIKALGNGVCERISRCIAEGQAHFFQNNFNTR